MLSGLGLSLGGVNQPRQLNGVQGQQDHVQQEGRQEFVLVGVHNKRDVADDTRNAKRPHVAHAKCDQDRQASDVAHDVGGGELAQQVDRVHRKRPFP